MWIRERWHGKVNHIVMADMKVTKGERVTARCGKSYVVSQTSDKALGGPVCGACVLTLTAELDDQGHLIDSLYESVRQMRNFNARESDDAKLRVERAVERAKENGWML